MNKLEQAAWLALDVLENERCHVSANWDNVVKAITALREALAEQAEQSQLADATLEPVAWMWKPSKPFPQYTVITDNKEHLKAAKEQGVEITPLYADPVRTKDLTELLGIMVGMANYIDKLGGDSKGFRAVIAADREKNK